MRRVLAALLLAASLAAATADDLLAQIAAGLPAEEQERGSPARAKAIAALVAKGGLDADTLLDLRLAEAEAEIEAGDGAAAARLATALAGDADAGAERRERAALAWVAAWALRARSGERIGEEGAGDPEAAVAAFRLRSRRPAARAATALGERLMAERKPEAVAACDRALALLADQPPEERVPVYALRLLAMEAAGEKPEAVQAWLQSKAGDPAAATVAESALTPGQRLVGLEAPRVSAARLDGKPGTLDLATLRGKPLLVDFFATWCKPCEAIAPALVQLRRRLGTRLQVVGVSLDTPETVARIPAFVARHGIDWPVIGDGVGWDSEIDDAFHVGAIPALVLIDAAGKVAAIDLVGDSVEATAANVERALQALEGGLPAAAASAAATRPGPAPAPELIP
jgi:thiol-disulfide isomerase/thioredoxin